VDNGGYFPETDAQQDYAWFLIDAMKMLGTDVVGTSEKELRFGAGFLTYHLKRAKLEEISSNLYFKPTKKPLLSPYSLKTVGGVKVGVFSVMSDKVDLGPARESLYVEEPVSVAKRMVAELRRKGANVVVALSELGKVESEDLAAAVEGVDVVIAGRNVPMVNKGRLVKNTVITYDGEQGQNMGRTIVTLGPRKVPTARESEVFVLLPEVGENAEVGKTVKQFEDAYNERMRKAQKESAVQQAALTQNQDRYLGSEVCIRCHQQEGEQWKGTAHARAFQTLVDAKKESDEDCISCHVVGYKQPGGFLGSVDSPQMKNVQCESCHGMGTQHDVYSSKPRPVTEQTCTQCHEGDNDPSWNYAAKLPMVLHRPATASR
jgi:hypothetical protein